MRREILMPAVTAAIEGGRISRWHVAEGQAVAAGDVLAEVVTATASLEIEAVDEGRVERILVPAGAQVVKANTPIAILFGEAGETPRIEDEALGFASLGEDVPRLSLRSQGEGQTYREALRDALADAMRADGRVFLIGVDVAQNRGAPCVAQGLVDEFGPERVVSVAAADEAMFGVAVGAALAGLRPVVEVESWGRVIDTITPYLASAAETFSLSGGRLPVPIVFRGRNGFSSGMTGAESRCVASQLAAIPGLKVAQPSRASAARALLKAAIEDGGPVAVLEHEDLYGSREQAADLSCGLGEARIARPGGDVTLVAGGRAVLIALEAADALQDHGIAAEVIDLMCVRPLDSQTIAASVTRTGRLATIEEGYAEFGVGAEIVASVVADCFGVLKGPPLRIGGAFVAMPYAEELQEAALPSTGDVVRRVARLVEATR